MFGINDGSDFLFIFSIVTFNNMHITQDVNFFQFQRKFQEKREEL